MRSRCSPAAIRAPRPNSMPLCRRRCAWRGSTIPFPTTSSCWTRSPGGWTNSMCCISTSIFPTIPSFATWRARTLTTLHGRQDLPELPDIYRAFPHMPLVSISNHQRLPVPPVNWMGTVYHGLPEAQFREGGGRGGYLAFLGRICSDKGRSRPSRSRAAPASPQDRRQGRSGGPGLLRRSGRAAHRPKPACRVHRRNP